jgi:hypothetical protein
MKELKDTMAWEILQVPEEVPIELEHVYQRMMKQIRRLKRQNPELCRQVLSTVITTYRPLHLQELGVLVDSPNQGPSAKETAATIVKMCGSFLTIRDSNIYIIHQSARDFLLSDEAGSSVFPSGTVETHRQILSRSILIMSKTLRRDIYNLGALGYSIKQVQQPKPDPLLSACYSCLYWIDHLCAWSSSTFAYDTDVLRGGGTVDNFLTKKYIYWLEALNLCKSMSKCVVSMAKLEVLTNVTSQRVISSSINDAN